MPGPITFLTDFGLQDDFVGVCRGVMKGIAPDVEIIDITHGIAPQAVMQGALLLARAVPYMPVGVHLAVVDPGVGGDRRAIAIRAADDRIYVGPDNGLLSLAAPTESIAAVRELTNPRFHLDRVSRTFHARDVFAPVAAHLASGARFDDLGDELDPETLVRIELPSAIVSSDHLGATVVAVDRFGNLQLNVDGEQIGAAGLRPGNRVELVLAVDSYYAVVAETFADASRGDLILYEDSYGAYSVAISGGNAGKLTGARPGDQLEIIPLRI
ncbi:MAG TPA: SAM-dependent chlorinase/fluorinase [Gaiellaceae bacterium]|nr:SAM-dependent chlorinase/fluorinase [Gaiellaceae bacterium]